MKQLEIAALLLGEIESEGIPFHDAVGGYFREHGEDQAHRGIVSNLVGTALRHKMLFDYALKYYDSLSEEDKRLASLAMANHYYSKRLDDQEVLAHLSETLGEEKAILIRSFMEKKREELLPPNIQRFETRYITLNFNCPQWVYHRIRSTLRSAKAYNAIRELTRQARPTLRVRKSHLDPEVLLNPRDGEPAYEETQVPGILSYVGKSPLRHRQEWTNNNVFLEKMGTKHVLDQVGVEDPGQILMYADIEDSSALRELIETYMDTVGLNLGVRLLSDHLEVRRMIRRDQLKNVNLFEAAPDALEAYVSRKQEAVFVLPRSTGFDDIPSAPDYLLRLKEEDVKGLVESQAKMLESLSEYVADEGKLVYMVYTIDALEAQDQIRSFLEKHSEYYCLKEEQFLPQESYRTALYYAILVKGEKPQWLIEQEEAQKAAEALEEERRRAERAAKESPAPKAEEAAPETPAGEAPVVEEAKAEEPAPAEETAPAPEASAGEVPAEEKKAEEAGE